MQSYTNTGSKKRRGCLSGCLIILLVFLSLMVGCSGAVFFGHTYVKNQMVNSIPPDPITNYFPKEPGTYEQIYLEYNEGKIDRKTEVLLRIKAAYMPELLPEEYSKPGPEDKISTLSRELLWLMENFDMLDANTQEIFKPFILSPLNPESYFHPDFDRNINTPRVFTFNKTAYASTICQLDVPDKVTALKAQNDNEEFWPDYRDRTEWDEKDIFIAGAPRITLYSINGASLDQNAQLEDIEEALRKAWPMFRQLLNTQPQEEIRVFLTDRITSYGDAIPSIEVIPYNDIRLCNTSHGVFLKSITVHELFHIFQFSMGLHNWANDDELAWLMEATATWSEHYVYPNPCEPPHPEHRYLEDFFQSVEDDRISRSGKYGSYMLFFFLNEHHGGPAIIPFMLKAAAQSADIRNTLMMNIDKEAYGKFALCTWNYHPRHCYSDGIMEIPPNKTTIPILAPGIYPQNESLKPGAMHYRVFDFRVPPDEIEHVTFEFKRLDEEESLCKFCSTSDEDDSEPPDRTGADKVMIQAMVKIDDDWLPGYEDWTDLEYKKYDRKKDNENVTKVILIFSNANMMENQECSLQYNVIAEGTYLQPRAAVGPTLGYQFPGGGEYLIMSPDAQEYRWNIPGVEYAVPLFPDKTTELHLPDSKLPDAAQLPRCQWPKIESGFSQRFQAGSRGIKVNGDKGRQTSGIGAYKTLMRVRIPGDNRRTEMYAVGRQYATQFMPPDLFEDILDMISNNSIVNDDKKVQYKWDFNLAALACPSNHHYATRVRAYGSTPSSEYMVVEIVTNPNRPSRERDIEIYWFVEAEGKNYSGNECLFSAKASYEVFDSCDPHSESIKSGELFFYSFNGTKDLCDSQTIKIKVPKEARYIQVEISVDAESVAQNRVNDEPVEVRAFCHIRIGIPKEE